MPVMDMDGSLEQRQECEFLLVGEVLGELYVQGQVERAPPAGVRLDGHALVEDGLHRALGDDLWEGDRQLPFVDGLHHHGLGQQRVPEADVLPKQQVVLVPREDWVRQLADHELQVRGGGAGQLVALGPEDDLVALAAAPLQLDQPGLGDHPRRAAVRGQRVTLVGHFLHAAIE
jgi:hypothetical protein